MIIFKTEDQEIFLTYIGYTVELVDVTFTVEGDRGYSDKDITVKRMIAYKGDRPDLNVGYQYSDFKVKHRIDYVFNREVGAHIISTILLNGTLS